MAHEHWLLPEGIDETLPPEARAQEALRRELLDLYHRWGYDLVFPPFIEYLDSLLSGTGSDLELQTFKITDQITGRTLGIRADITPQAARIDAHKLRHGGTTRLCYLGTVLKARGEGMAASRSPLQIGAELYGHGGVEAELEILTLMLETLERAGIGGIHLDLGHVGIYRGLAQRAGLAPADEQALFGALQRKAVPELQQLVDGFGLERALGRMLVGLAEMSGGREVLEQAPVQLAGAGEEVVAALTRLRRLADLLAQRVPGIPVHYDLAELRGYHYHTGVVFAAFVPGQGQELARGGRYDAIGRLFGRARPACGFSADLKQLFRLGRREAAADEPAVLAPPVQEPGLEEKVAWLRSRGRRVVQALSGEPDETRASGCGEKLAKQGGEWVVVPI
ncbi:MAG TPA: ATP phosphoribosyltransferase regulatory subunit [Sedimenticola sp.]|nr:ATP phosphoribosyltransferase regulatory subunit [Sedimenticola sp.]